MAFYCFHELMQSNNVSLNYMVFTDLHLFLLHQHAMMKVPCKILIREWNREAIRESVKTKCTLSSPIRFLEYFPDLWHAYVVKGETCRQAKDAKGNLQPTTYVYEKD